MTAPLAAARAARGHAVQMYEDERFLLDTLVRFAGGGLGAGDPVIVIATEAHLARLAERLSERQFDLVRARSEGRYVELDAVTTLEKLMVDGRPDRARFAEIIAGPIALASKRSSGPVRAFGEMVALLVAELRYDAAIELESLWNELARARPLSLLCAYPVSAFADPAGERSLLEVCSEHAHVLPAESYGALDSEDERAREVAHLQRKALVLEKEILQRRNAEEARQRALRELTTLYDMGRVLSAELDVQRLLQTLTDAARKLSGAEFGAFFYNATDDTGGHYLLYTLSGADRESFDRFGMPRNTAIFAPTFAGEAIIRLADVRADPRYGKNAPRHGMPEGHLPVASYLAVPVVSRTGEVFGGLFLGHPTPGVFGEDAERGVAELARQAAGAIENARLYDAERRARGEAETANRAKDEFLAMLGHELRNPLSAVRNAVVAARFDAQRRDRALDIASRGVDQLARLVDDLLDVARITNGKIVLRRELIPLADIVLRSLEVTRSLVEERGHGLEVSIPAAGAIIDGDATRLEQVVVNLLSNAAKYTAPGGRISVSVEIEGDEVVLRVSDTGIGIAPEMLPRVFELFAQADRGLDRAEGGLGVGLTVVKRLVELHGGRVEAHSEGPGSGAEFSVRLPAQVGSADSEFVSAEDPTRARVRVLLVEDNDDAADSLALMLQSRGHSVVIARDGVHALEAARADPPDVMLTDIGLPGIDGFEVARRVRADASLENVMLVALTGYGRSEDRERAREAGFDRYLVKPIGSEALRSLIASVSERERR